MSDEIWHPLLRSALAVLALPAEKQIDAFQPQFPIPYEILDNFDHAQHVALANRDRLSADQIDSLIAINQAMESMPPESMDDYNSQVLFKPYWQTLRDLAQVGLKAFGWEHVVVFPCIESRNSPGIWEGPSAE